MKKILIIGLVAFFSLVLMYGFADAKVSGACYKCHTMHNSQGGTPEAKDFSSAASSTPYGHLTKSSCIGCHNGVITDSGAPNIFGTTTRTAGGTFAASVVDGFPNKVHNVQDISYLASDQVGNLGSATPGTEAHGSFTPPAGANNLYCAGANGCHGKHDVSGSDAGIRGFHHGSEQGYRYLQFYNGTTHTPIQGKGSSTWESGGATSGNHNVYFAMSAYNASTNDSISSLCALCHGHFHGEGTATDVYSGGAWVRHPTENLLSAASGWNMNSVTISYDNNPFGFNGSDYTSASTTSAYDTTGARVVCVSCHRAHGTDNDDILRWNYSNMAAGSTTVSYGCLGCHHKQRG